MVIIFYIRRLPPPPRKEILYHCERELWSHHNNHVFLPIRKFMLAVCTVTEKVLIFCLNRVQFFKLIAFNMAWKVKSSTFTLIYVLYVSNLNTPGLSSFIGREALRRQMIAGKILSFSIVSWPANIAEDAYEHPRFVSETRSLKTRPTALKVDHYSCPSTAAASNQSTLWSTEVSVF